MTNKERRLCFFPFAVVVAIFASAVHGFSVQPYFSLRKELTFKRVTQPNQQSHHDHHHHYHGECCTQHFTLRRRPIITRASPSGDTSESTRNAEPQQYPSPDGTVSASAIYFDIQVGNNENDKIGRLIFDLANPSPLPWHTENIIQLAKGSRRGIDPKAHYVGCEFDYSPLTVEEEDGRIGRYRWSHQIKGRGRNAIGRADQAIVDVENQRRNTHSCYGGQYYGVRYDTTTTTTTSNNNKNDKKDPGVLLTVPILGPGHGTSKWSIVRVGESPKEWGDRLLLNSGVIGKLRAESLPVLHAMARQRRGPPTVVAAGVLDE
ncbi:hypothetical protein ACA910_020201 [Epithemia clementina (nom. ined.)]